MKRLLPMLAMVLASPGATAGCWGNPPPLHGDHGRDRHGLAWHSEPVCYHAEFVAGALTLDAEAREALAQRLEGARRMYSTDCVFVTHGPEQAHHQEGRVTYLRWWLGLQNVALHAKTPLGRWEPDRSGDVIELQVEPCSWT